MKKDSRITFRTDETTKSLLDKECVRLRVNNSELMLIMIAGYFKDKNQVIPEPLEVKPGNSGHTFTFIERMVFLSLGLTVALLLYLISLQRKMTRFL